VVLQPTAPLRTGEDIDSAFKILMETGADAVVSVYRVCDHHPARMYRMVNDRLVPYATEPASGRRQDLPPVYHRNGAIYAFRKSLLEEGRVLMGGDVRPYIMPSTRSINIDEELDLLLADAVLQKSQRQHDTHTKR
jgi:CMP-N-acetylneuraminic acid synthetase